MSLCLSLWGLNMKNKERSVVILGASGHAKVIASVVSQLGRCIAGFYDDNQDLHDTVFQGAKVLGDLDDAFLHDDVDLVLGIAINALRKKLYERYPDAPWASIISPLAYCNESSHIGLGSIIMAGAIIQPDVSIGNQCIINTRASVDHDVVLHDYVQVSPGVTICGSVQIGEGSYIGAGSVIKQGVNIGSHVMIGAGSVVVKDIPSHVMVHGDAAEVVKSGVFV
jgi:sugar O-acyltransferase (sialic acid O-acetyltransferase NeuD family)